MSDAEESAKAVQSVADAAGKAIDAGREAGGFLAKFITEPMQELSGIWTDNLRHRRWENQIELQKRAAEKMDALGREVCLRKIPMSVGVPLLQAASLEEVPELQDLWASLIVNFANADSDVDVSISFVSVLQQLTPLDAKIIQAIYSTPQSNVGIYGDGLPEVVRREERDDDPNSQGMPSRQIALSLANLVRLGCIATGATWGGGESLAQVFESTFGRALFEACTLRKTR